MEMGWLGWATREASVARWRGWARGAGTGRGRVERVGLAGKIWPEGGERERFELFGFEFQD